MVVACVALFVALAGTATAAKLITGRQIKNSSITTRDIRNRSLLAQDFRPGQLPAGRPGPAGPAGAPGANGVADLSYEGNSAALGAGGTPTDNAYVVAVCPAGRYPVGGDAYAVEVDPSDPEDPVDPAVRIAEGFTVNVTTRVPSGWFGRASNPTNKAFTLFVDAICAGAETPPPPLAATAVNGRGAGHVAGRAR